MLTAVLYRYISGIKFTPIHANNRLSMDSIMEISLHADTETQSNASVPILASKIMRTFTKRSD